MNVKYCDFCPQSGKCEHQDKGYECVTPVKLLYLENHRLKSAIREIDKEIFKKKSYESKIIAIKGIVDKC